MTDANDGLTRFTSGKHKRLEINLYALTLLERAKSPFVTGDDLALKGAGMTANAVAIYIIRHQDDPDIYDLTENAADLTKKAIMEMRGVGGGEWAELILDLQAALNEFNAAVEKAGSGGPQGGKKAIGPSD